MAPWRFDPRPGPPGPQAARGDRADVEEDPYLGARRRMVDQLRVRGLADERVLCAMGEVPRERFVPEEVRDHAYDDGALPIGEGQTISQPWLVASMAALLELEGEERVLEIGTGSGYGAAILSRLCREVVTIERHAALADQAREALRLAGCEERVEVRVGDGSQGAPDRAPFAGITVTASAQNRPPPRLEEQLAPGGALVCPVRRGGGETLMCLREGEEREIVPVRFVPLVEGTPP